jgi:hypothetical protein
VPGTAKRFLRGEKSRSRIGLPKSGVSCTQGPNASLICAGELFPNPAALFFNRPHVLFTERMVKGEKDKKQKPGRTYGPYYQWTFKREGKTITVNLTKEQAKLYQRAIDNNREMEETLKEMRVLSEKILEAQTEGVKRRKTSK